ncbi:putative alpha(1,3)fucosyltransferase, partial [Schistosoma mansoni]|uniref:putative alpha(1,3)fucosyltransferase n=1 Tax=Schistosoma mansoni TaxID=6183 RepID=UPI00022DC9A7
RKTLIFDFSRAYQSTASTININLWNKSKNKQQFSDINHSWTFRLTVAYKPCYHFRFTSGIVTRRKFVFCIWTMTSNRWNIIVIRTSDKYYDSDETRELSTHHLRVYDGKQLEKDKPKSNSMIELELARLRITQLEKEIELEKLRCHENEGNFEECTGSENIGFRANLNYLIQYCDGEAKAAILHCAILEPQIGYHQALKPLEETFGRKHMEPTRWFEEIFPGNESILFDSRTNELRFSPNTYRTIEIIVLKLPTHVQQKWLKTAYKVIRGGCEPLFTDLTAFAKQQADMANTRKGLLVNRDSNSDNRDIGVLKGRISPDYSAATISYTSSSDDNAHLRSLSCVGVLR